MRRRLLIALLLVIALAGGLWWNSTRLNETEKRLVGVWQADESNAWILLPDHRLFSPQSLNGKWTCSQQTATRWKASPHLLSIRMLPPTSTSLQGWRTFVANWWNGDTHGAARIIRFTDEEIEMEAEGDVMTLRHSQEPELLRMFEQLTAEESL